MILNKLLSVLSSHSSGERSILLGFLLDEDGRSRFKDPGLVELGAIFIFGAPFDSFNPSCENGFGGGAVVGGVGDVLGGSTPTVSAASEVLDSFGVVRADCPSLPGSVDGPDEPPSFARRLFRI